MRTLADYTGDRTKLIDELIAELEGQVSRAQGKLYRQLLEKVFDKLQVKDGRIVNSTYNKRLLSSVDTVFGTFTTLEAIPILQTVVTGVDRIIKFNTGFTKGISGNADLANTEASIRQTMNEWLGIEKGAIKPNGYLDRLVSDASVRNQVKDFVLKEVVSQSGQSAARERLGNLINGRGEELGALQKYHKQFVQDTFSVADRVVGIEYANKKGYEFAIYEGGLIKTSRPFCIARNGKVFHRSEIAEWNPKEAKPPNYNPFTDAGGFNCRHHLNWIPQSLALELRPNAKDFLANSNS